MLHIAQPPFVPVAQLIFTALKAKWIKDQKYSKPFQVHVSGSNAIFLELKIIKSPSEPVSFTSITAPAWMIQICRI
ncbi:MAG: hypothetical protein R3275_09745 [Saprospiraceae bacterium]|nr:hypothetical protein [Saprospiraceae bacterium]